jgi:hypothetical protein
MGVVIRVVLAAVLAVFAALMARVLTQQSYVEFVETATANAATALLFLDLGLPGERSRGGGPAGDTGPDLRSVLHDRAGGHRSRSRGRA